MFIKFLMLTIQIGAEFDERTVWTQWPPIESTFYFLCILYLACFD